jgi:hypothetical protein
MRNDAPDNAVWMRQQWRLCEMSLEATAHRLLTRTITELTRGATAGYGAQWEGWVYAPWALALALSHVRLSRWAPIECTVLVLELGAWAAEGDAAHHPAAALRMQVRVKPSCSEPLRLALGAYVGVCFGPSLGGGSEGTAEE